MDMFLGKVTQHAMNYAIRSGIGLTASFAIRQSAKLLSTAPKSSVRDELYQLQRRLQHKIHIISPAIDMIELIAARGHTSLESAVSLTKELRLDIQSLGQRLAAAASASADAYRTRKNNNAHAQAQNELELKLIVSDIKRLIERIEDAVPLINLAITTSGASLSTTLPHTVSPSRLLQASTFLTAGDTQYSITPQRAIQIGPTFTLTIYMLFAGHDRPQNEEDIRETTWKEVMHKARVKLRRVPLDMVMKTGSGSDAIPAAQINAAGWNVNEEPSTTVPAEARVDEYAYQMMIIEDYDDDRYHDFDQDNARPEPFDDVYQAGIREMLPIHEISKIFYADTSKVLNIGSDAESNHPVLLLKRDLNAVPPRRMLKDETPIEFADEENGEQEECKDLHDKPQQATEPPDGQVDPWRLPPSLDPEWIAFEVYTEPEPSDSEDEDINQPNASTTPSTTTGTDQSPSNLATSLSHLRINTPSTASPTLPPSDPFSKIKTSLSLLELLLRLTSLQQFQQQSHLSITDELLNFFLEESASTGAGGDEAYRQHLRTEARRRVGWDPYDESPVKRRGEDYQYQHQYQAPSPYESGTGSGRGFYPSPDMESTRGVTPTSPVDGNERSNSTGPGGWSPRDINPQTRSGMHIRDAHASPSPNPNPILTSPHPQSSGARTRSWAKRERDDMKRGSPLRPNTAVTDEGIGTSPASGNCIGIGKNR